MNEPLGTIAPFKPEVHFVAGTTATQQYWWEGSHIVLVTGSLKEDQNRVGFRATRRHLMPSRSKYTPHQGAQECARRRAS